jgi:hypothetical protein
VELDVRADEVGSNVGSTDLAAKHQKSAEESKAAARHHDLDLPGALLTSGIGAKA